MKNRKTRIVTGCHFVAGLIRDGRDTTETFKNAIKRLHDLLLEEINNEPDIEEIFAEKV